MDPSPPSTLIPIVHAQETSREEPWRILLVELVHLLSLFLTHARHAKASRATGVLFDQIVRRLHILEKMPGHDGGMIIRRIDNKPDYFFLFGNQAFRGSDAILRSRSISKSISSLDNALDHALGCLYELGIFALYLQLPGRSIEKIDQLRLSLNILARFRSAVENNASITFRYSGRVMAVPLVRDNSGRPDPNLTVVAGLNGLSAINMRELIKQACAFCELAHMDQSVPSANNYNQIFGTRSLRSQLIQPPVEINNLPWMQYDSETLPAGSDLQTAKAPDETDGMISALLDRPPSAFHLSPAYLRACLGTTKAKVQEAVDSLFDPDFSSTNAQGLGRYMGLVSLLLYELEQVKSDPMPFERVLSFVHARLERVPEPLMEQLTVQRQAIKVLAQRTILVGMVHPRLLDLLSVVKERMAMRNKIAIVHDRISDFNRSDLKILADHFEIHGAGSDQVFELLKACFDDQGRFNRIQFATHIDSLAQQAHGFFEILWCILRCAPQAQDRFAILDALPLLVERLVDRKAALGFLLSDLFQTPDRIEASDRNAFGLATQILRTQNQEHGGIRSTPEEVLSVRKSINAEIVRHAAWRMDIERERVLAKFISIRHALYPNAAESAAAVPLTGGLSIPFLLLLEREGLIFISLVGGKTARMVLRNALDFYGNAKREIYQKKIFSPYFKDIMTQLRIILRGMARLGERQDLETLKSLEQSATQYMALDVDPAFARCVKQTLQWVVPAIRSIQLQLK